jgi:hypothetical protein
MSLMDTLRFFSNGRRIREVEHETRANREEARAEWRRMDEMLVQLGQAVKTLEEGRQDGLR